MKSLTIYVSIESRLLEAKHTKLYTERGIYGFMFPESNQHPIKQVWWTKDLINRNDLKNLDVALFTHSATIISCVGDYIEDVCHDFKDKVKIIILEKDGKQTISTFDEDGCLMNWPIGFFNGRV
jgi:predicted ATPase